MKDLVIYRLSQNSLATVNDLHTAIEKQRNGISYHAVHKACRQLVAQGVLRRDKKMYLISPEWVERLCKFMDRVKASYSGQKFVNMAGLKEFFEGDARTFVFDNLEEADNYRKRLQWEYLTLEGDKKPYCAMSRHLRSPLFSSERALNIMNMATKARSQAFIIVAGDTHIDRWCSDYYRNEFVRVQTGVPCAETCDTMILGDVVVQLHLSDELRTKFETTYINTSNVSDMNVSDFYNSMYRSPAAVKLTVMRNAELAQQLREQVMTRFDFKRIAVFDINGTLVDEFLVTLFAEYMMLNGKFDTKKMEEIAPLMKVPRTDASYDRSLSKIMELYAGGLKGRTVEEVSAMARSFVEEGRVPVFRQSRRLFNWVNSHYRTIAITKTTGEIMEALKSVFAFDDVLASQLEVKGGKFTGRVASSLASRAAKAKSFKAWLKSANASLEGSIAFGDMAHDFAFMEHVEKPILLNPEPKDAKIAKKRKWLVFDQSSDAAEMIAALRK